MHSSTPIPSFDADASAARSFHPGLVTGRFHETWDFYTELLGFRTDCACDDYVQLSHPCGSHLGILREEVDGNPSELISRTDGRGFWLSMDVANVDAEYDRLRAARVPIAFPPEDKPWGERLCAVRDPNGVLVVLTQQRSERRTATLELAAAS